MNATRCDVMVKLLMREARNTGLLVRCSKACVHVLRGEKVEPGEEGRGNFWRQPT